MKKIILGIVFLFTVSFAFASNDLESNLLKNNQVDLIDVTFSMEDSSQSELLSFEVINLISLELESTLEDYPCRWRYCITSGGVKYCTEWEYGECLPVVQL